MGRTRPGVPVVGAHEGLASYRELAHQLRHGPRVAKELGIADRLAGTNELQVRERSQCGPAELISRLERAGPGARQRRRRLAKPLRRGRVPASGEGAPLTLGQVMDVVYTRGVWMHRVDLCRVVHREMELSHAHDGRIVADVAREWAGAHGQPFRLELTGPAGGTFVQGDGGTRLEVDAIGFCRALSGRADGAGLLVHRVAF